MPMNIIRDVASPGLRRGRSRCAAAIGLALLLSPAGRAQGVDGVIDINQARAHAGDVTPGDDPGFPVLITEPGSYRLTGNLTPATPSQSGILIAVSHVSIDLNGYSVRGSRANCAAPPAACVGTGTGRGIAAASTANHIRVYNGSVRGAAHIGVQFSGRDSVLENVRVSLCGSDGIRIGANASVIRSQVSDNLGTGIDVGAGSRIEHSIVARNQVHGIELGTGSTAMGNVVHRSFQSGIFLDGTDGSATIIGNVLYDNGADGLAADGNAANAQENVVGVSGGRGIAAGNGSLIRRNIAIFNTGQGFVLGAQAGYVHNLFRGNNAEMELQGAGGVQLGTNYCGQNPTCP